MLTRDLFVVSNLVTAGFTNGLYLAEIQFTGKNGILNDVTITSSFRSAVLIGFSVTWSIKMIYAISNESLSQICYKLFPKYCLPPFPGHGV